MKLSSKKNQTERIVLTAVMTALVIILQVLATATTWFGPFSTAVALIPIAIGACMCGIGVGAWLGVVFGVVVMVTGGANLFFAFDIPGTVVTVLLKGAACGAAAGLVYRLLEKWNSIVAAISAAVICPIANTAVFLLGCAVFFLDDANGIAEMLGLEVSGMALFWMLAIANFLFEVGMNLVLSPVIVRLLSIRKKH